MEDIKNAQDISEGETPIEHEQPETPVNPDTTEPSTEDSQTPSEANTGSDSSSSETSTTVSEPSEESTEGATSSVSESTEEMIELPKTGYENNHWRVLAGSFILGIAASMGLKATIASFRRRK